MLFCCLLYFIGYKVVTKVIYGHQYHSHILPTAQFKLQRLGNQDRHREDIYDPSTIHSLDI